uniref:Uncharacterized protein n=1 Tax=Cacopsylla melanoneura TaxID=428564 RepID=A0A8D8YYV9_9HEMI
MFGSVSWCFLNLHPSGCFTLLFLFTDVTASNPLCQSESFISKNTSLLKSFSCFEPSSSTVTTNNGSFNGTSNNDEDNLKQLIQQVTKQDLILDIINKCVQEENTELKPPQDVPTSQVGKSVPTKNTKISRFTESKISKYNDKFNTKKFTNSTPSTINRAHNANSTPYNTNGTTNGTTFATTIGTTSSTATTTSLLDSELKNKIKKIIKYNSLKATYDENNLAQVLVVESDLFDIGRNENEMKLNKQEADALNEVVEKCVDQMYMHTILEKRHLSTKSSLNRIQELQSKITAKYHAVESLLTSIGNTQDEMLRLSTEEYKRSVVQDSYKMTAMSVANVNKLHAQVVISLGMDGGTNMSQSLQSHQPSPTTAADLNESFLGLDDSISSLSYSISSLKLELSDLEQRLTRHKQLESNPASASVVKTIRKLKNAIKQKTFILKRCIDENFD